jgi:hypothetical protein
MVKENSSDLPRSHYYVAGAPEMAEDMRQMLDENSTPVAASCAKKAGDECRSYPEPEDAGFGFTYLGEPPMQRFYATATLWATLALVVSSAFEASFAGATDTPEKTVPQGQDPPGADNGEQSIPPLAEDKEVIPPPPIGDEGIYTDAPNPEAGHEEEVIPPPAPGEEPSVKPR